jgi:hypothetical protein
MHPRGGHLLHHLIGREEERSTSMRMVRMYGRDECRRARMRRDDK